MANLGVYNGVAAKPSGETLVRAPAATIEVRREDTGAFAQIYSDEAGTALIVNPSAFADANGNFRFYAAGLERGYRVTVTDGAFSLVLNNQAVGTKAQLDIDTPITTKGDIVVGNASGRQARKAVGTNGQALMADSAQGDGLVWQELGYRSTQVFTANGTWTKPAGLKRVKVTVIGGGGGSGGSGSTAGTQAGASGGGGSGGYSQKVIEAASLGATETVTVGVGGLAGTAGATTGGTGGTTSFGTHCQSTGGAGSAGVGARGDAFPVVGGSGGTGSGGNINLVGGSGQMGLAAGPSATGVGGVGGQNPLSGAATSVSTTTTSAGNTGALYGGGASGSCNGQNQANTAGTAGAAGLVIVEEFF